MDRSEYPTRLTRLGLEEGSGCRVSDRRGSQRIDLLTSITGVTFDDARANRVHVDIGELGEDV